ncbi:hypothetical protein N7530_011349 [Penicillium desertorum]|uniref:Uncharacterized protein n=1 Tax=Penicillium desertorum TaxID=1303715 RepID=A0A9W9WHI4_9EURO|nr:hypothetical protein N7530_011349 [Penicillium desertorum]
MSLWDDLDSDSESSGTLRLQSFLGLYIFALLYELALSYDALRRKNTIQLVGLCICNQGLFTYGLLQMNEIKDTISSSTNKDLGDRLKDVYHVEIIIVPVILGVGTVCMSFFTWKLRAEFSWSIYKNVSADLQMKRRYFTYQPPEDMDFVVNASVIPITIATLVLSAQFCKREKTKSLVFMMFLMLLIVGFLVLILLRMYSSNDSTDFSSFRTSLTLFAGVSLLLMVLTIVNSVMCILNFNKGLKNHVHPPKKGKTVSLELESQETPTRFLLN